jgi:hypothetical protein
MMTNTPILTSPLLQDVQAGGVRLSMECAAATAAFRAIDKVLAVTFGAALAGHAALPAWLTTTEFTVCAAHGAALLGAGFLRRRAATDPVRWLSGGPSFRPGQLAPGELPRSTDRC